MAITNLGACKNDSVLEVCITDPITGTSQTALLYVKVTPTGLTLAYTGLDGVPILPAPNPATVKLGRCGCSCDNGSPQILDETPGGISLSGNTVQSPQPLVVKSLTLTNTGSDSVSVSFDAGLTFPLVVTASSTRTWGQGNQDNLITGNMRFQGLSATSSYDLVWEV